jgi:hypothetical protein
LIQELEESNGDEEKLVVIVYRFYSDIVRQYKQTYYPGDDSIPGSAIEVGKKMITGDINGEYIKQLAQTVLPSIKLFMDIVTKRFVDDCNADLSTKVVNAAQNLIDSVSDTPKPQHHITIDLTYEDDDLPDLVEEPMPNIVLMHRPLNPVPRSPPCVHDIGEIEVVNTNVSSN